MNYDNMTDKELIREAEGKAGLIHALSERLDMRRQPDSVFHDYAYFMRAIGQETARDTPKQAERYMSGIQEVVAAMTYWDDAETFNRVIDLIGVCIGYGLSRGWPMERGWQEHVRAVTADEGPDMERVLSDYERELS